MTPSSPKPPRESQSRPAEPPAGPKQPSPAVADRRPSARSAAEAKAAMAQHGAVGGGIAGAVHDAHDAGAAVGTGRRAVHGVQAPGSRPERRRGVRARRIDRRGAQEGRAAARASQDKSYQQFTTERPTFAKDDLLAELTTSGATVRAKPLVQQRGFLMNILVSLAPIAAAVRVLELDVAAPAGRDGRDPRRRKAAAGRPRNRSRRRSRTSPASTRSRPRSTRSSTS